MKSLIQGPGFPFVAPFALFMGLLYLRQSFSQHGWWLYGVCSLLVFGLLLWLRPRYKGQDPAPPRALPIRTVGTRRDCFMDRARPVDATDRRTGQYLPICDRV